MTDLKTWEVWRVWLAFVVLCLAGCQSVNPVAVAETPAQKAYAVERTYNIVLEGALDLVNDPAVGNSFKKEIRQTEARTTPIVNNLSQAFKDYVVARAALDLGEATPEKVQILAANLDSWIRQAERALVELATVIE